MFAKLRGTVEEIEVNVITLDVHGVGYEVICSDGCLATIEIGKEVSIIAFTDVREDSIRLYGFADVLEKQVFLLLKTVQGVGTRTAMEIVSNVDKIELLRTIAAEDEQKLQKIKGVGKKTAGRLIVELKDRVADHALERHESRLKVEKQVTDPMQEACEALEALGFSRKVAETAVAAVKGKGVASKIDSAWVVKEALRYI
jgi:Holliday junction DNA helicase RuvA